MKHIKLFEDYKPLSLGLVIVDYVDDNEEIVDISNISLNDVM
jgi:hypothetical protein